MKGHLYYTREDAQKNKLFIEDLIEEASTFDISLRLLLDQEAPDDDTDFILFRSRNDKLSKQFELSGWRVFNRNEVNRIANHKLRTFELAVLLGIPAVPTKKFSTIDQIETFPFILKTVDGHGGNEVYLAQTKAKVEQLLFQFKDSELISQPYIESGAQDIRVFIIGSEVIGAVKRTGNNSFKSNFTLGGTIEKYLLSREQEQDALIIAKALKSDYIGIDFLLLADGRWLLNEIEDPVGARSLYLTHDFSVANKLMAYIHKEMKSK